MHLMPAAQPQGKTALLSNRCLTPRSHDAWVSDPGFGVCDTLARMVSTVLSGPWKGHATDDELRRACIEPGFDDTEWPMTVPGHWAEHDRLSTRRSVLCRTRFDLDRAGREPSSRHWLLFDGIWQSADVWLNGHYLGPIDGWFITHEFEITEALARPRRPRARRRGDGAGTDRSTVPARSLDGIYDDAGIVGHTTPGGIWRPVRIVATGPVRMTKTRVICSAADADAATVHFRCHVLSDESRPVTIVTTVRPPGGGPPITMRRDHDLASGATVLEWDVHIDRPALWWPWELGDQPLHRITVSVEFDDSISDLWDREVGLRSVSMRNWVLWINGERLFARGADLWPTPTALAANADPTSNETSRWPRTLG